ncbi:MAG TPA: gamma-glutamyltransferase [Ktedonobacterales bacterium]
MDGDRETKETDTSRQGASTRLTRRDITSAMAISGATMSMTTSAVAESAETEPSQHGVVAAGSQPAADAGAEILAAGGNAVDAAIATAIAMAVVDPANTSVMGRTHILVLNESCECAAINGRSAVPAAWQGGKATTAAGVIPVGGNLRSYEEAVRRFGRLTLAQVCTPAIRLARDGFVVRSNLARAWSRMAPDLQRNPVTARLFLKAGGLPWRDGETFRQPQLGKSLAHYATGGADRFLDQTLARDLRALQRAGSQLSAHDFHTYRPIDAEHVETHYRGWDVWTIGRQGYGYFLSEVLAFLEAHDLQSLSDGDRWAVMLVAQRVAFRDRTVALGADASSVVDRGHIQSRGQEIRALLESGNVASLFAAEPPTPGVPHDTTHISAVDAQGMVASITQSIGPHFGSAFASPGGYLFAHSYQMESGQRIEDRDTTAMLPTILRSPDGMLTALEAAGSDRIRGAVIRAIVNMVDLGMSPQRAASEPACVIHDGYVQVSPELEASVPSRLAQIGIPTRLVARNEGEHFGLLHIAGRYADGRFAAGADTYWDGGSSRA